MFERDIQPILNRYLAGAVPEDVFLRGSRPWLNYGTDYRRLIEFAKLHGSDDYLKRFGNAMGHHPIGTGPPPSPGELAAMTERCYHAPGVKDETMAKSIVRARSDADAPLVIQ